MTIIITGSKGQLGKEIIKQLSLYDCKLVTCDIDDIDISDYDAIKNFCSKEEPDIIINCAAYTAVDQCESEEELAYKVNAIGPRNLAIISNDLGAKLIHISTDYVYDGNGIEDEKGQMRPYNEFDGVNPQTVYGKTKLEGEKFVQRFNTRHFIIRTAWLYGDGNNFVRTMVKLSETHKELKVVDDQFGTPTSTEELAKSILSLVGSDNYGLFHGTCEGQCSWYEFAKEIFRLKNIDIDVIPCTTEEFPRPAKRPAYSVIDNYMFNITNGHKFAHWKDALEKYIIQGGA